jgi:nickel-dependent lactate racemase
MNLNLYKRFEVPTLAWYGQKMQELQFPEEWHVSFLPMEGYNKPLVGSDEIVRALREPIGTKPLKKLAAGKREAVIVVDDMTRVTRAYQIIPYIMQELKEAGISYEHVRFIMGGGLHGAWYRDDFSKKLGEDIVRNYPVYNHNPFANCTYVGKTSRGTPVEINSEYHSCDLRIGIGSVVPHPMTGYGGGAKIILPGIASYNMIFYNHMVVHRQNPPAESYWGFLKGNQTRADIDEAGKIAGMDMKVDVLLNGVGDSTDVFAGDLQMEFTEAVKVAREHYSTKGVPEKVDVIVANTYAKANEATLAYSNWKDKVKEDGVMVIIAQAPEGQSTHYLYGKFGVNEYAPGHSVPSKPPFKKLIIFSEYKVPDPFLPIAEPSSMVWLDNWMEVVEEIKNTLSHTPRVLVLPNAEIQCDEKILKRDMV